MSRKLSNFFYHAWEGRAFYGSIILAFLFAALGIIIGNEQRLDFIARLYISGTFLLLTFLCVFLLYMADVPDHLKFAWWHSLRLICWLFGCKLIDGWGGGGMHIPDAECIRCRQMCGNRYRPLYEASYWKRKKEGNDSQN
jgi:hypothetical protein